MKEYVTDRDTSMAAMTFFYANSRYKKKTEYLTYTYTDLLTSLGSFTSLFLGYNLRTIYGAMRGLVNKSRKKF